MAGSNVKIIIDLVMNGDQMKKGLEMNTAAAGQLVKGLAQLAGGAAILGAIGKEAWAIGSAFETSMALVSTLIDTQVVDFEKLKKSVKDTAAQYGYSAKESADALYDLLSTGIKAGDSIDMLAQNMKAARGANADLGNVTDVVTSVIAAYGLEAKDTEMILDKLIKTQDVGKVTIDEMAGSMGRVLPVAKQFNVSFDDVLASVAALTRLGMPAEVAITSVRQAIAQMGDESSKSGEALRELSGKSFSELMAEGRNLGEVIGMLEKHAEDTGQEFAALFPEINALAGASGIASGDFAIFNEALAEVQGSAGITNEYFEKMSQTGEALSATIKSKLQSAMIDLYDSIMISLKPALKWLADNMDWLAPILISVAVGLGLLLVAFGLVNIAMGIAGLVSLPLIASFAGIALAVGAVVGVLVGVGLAFADFYKTNEDFRNRLTRIWEDIKKAFADAGERIKDVFEKMKPGIETLKKVFEKVVGILTDVADKLSTLVGPALELVTDVINQVVVPAFNFLAEVFEDVVSFIETYGVPIFERLVDVFRDTIIPAVGELVGVFERDLLPTFKNIWDIIEQYVMPPVGKLADFLSVVLVDAINLLVPIFMFFYKTLSYVFKETVKALTPTLEVVGAVIEGIIDVFRGLYDFIIGIFSGNWERAWDGIKNIFVGIWEMIVSSAESLFGDACRKILKTFDDIKKGIADWWSGFSDWLWELPGQMLLWGVALFAEASIWIQQKAMELSAWVKQTWDDLLVWLWELPGRLLEWGSNLLIEALAIIIASLIIGVVAITKTFVDLLVWLWELPGKLAVWGAELFSKAVQWIKKAIADLKDWIINTWNSVVTWLWELPGKLLTWGAELFIKANKAIEETCKAICDWVPQAWDNLVTWLWELPGRIADWGRNLFTGAKGEIMGGHDNINDGIRSKWEGVVGWLRGLPGQFTEIGRNIIQGMWNGLSSMFDNMTGWLGSKVGQLVDSVKGKLGIASPSKVFKQLGAWTGEGFQIGLSYSMDDAQAGLIDSMDSISKVKLPTIDVGTINGSIGNRVGSTSNSSTDNSSTVFNITGTNAKDIASEIDKILGKKRRLRV